MVQEKVKKAVPLGAAKRIGGQCIKMEEAFLVSACLRREKRGGCTDDMLEYVKKSGLCPGKDQMLLIGRALVDLRSGDALLTPNETRIELFGFHLYGAMLDAVGAGCTCAILCSAVKEDVAAHMRLKRSPHVT